MLHVFFHVIWKDEGDLMSIASRNEVNPFNQENDQGFNQIFVNFSRPDPEQREKINFNSFVVPQKIL